MLLKRAFSKIKDQFFLYNYLYCLKKSEKWSKEKLAKYQLKKLKKILSVAVNTVPYYENLKQKIDFNNFTFAELNKFPIINKEIIRRNPNAFISQKYKKQGNIQHTSGSSGIPFEFITYPYNEEIDKAYAMRAWGMGVSGYKPGEAVIMLRSYAPKDNEPIFKIKKIDNFWYLSAYNINKENLNNYIRIIKKSKSKILRGYPSSIYIFTLLLKESNIKLDQIKTIITSSETLLPKYREEIENYWKLPVLDWYGQNEKTVTVQQCSFGRYHNNDEYGIVEVDSNNHIIATSLNNYIMPFIRYDTEDIAIPNPSKIDVCTCGRNLSVPFLGIEGRSDDILIKLDNTKIPTINIYTAIHTFNKVKQFKIIQNEDKSIIMQIVENPKIDNNYLKQIEHELKKRTGEIPITFEFVSEIKRNEKTGKIKAIESKIRNW